MTTAANNLHLLQTAFEIVETSPSIEVAVHQLRDLLGVDHVVYNSSAYGTDPAIKPYVRLTYSATWVKRYLQMGYSTIDPVLRHGFKRSLPFYWDDLPIENPEEAAMLLDAIQHGVGPLGFSVPLASKGGHRALFSISTSASSEAWRRYVTSNIPNFIEIANKLHTRVVRENFGEEHHRLTARETEVLNWVSQGKEAGDIAIILNISVFTVRDHLKSARFKLGCVTLAQAVSKAILSGLLPNRDP